MTTKNAVKFWRDNANRIKSELLEKKESHLTIDSKTMISVRLTKTEIIAVHKTRNIKWEKVAVYKSEKPKHIRIWLLHLLRNTDINGY